MQNPQTARQLSPDIIYSYQTHRNIPWNQIQYQPLRQYLDPMKQMTERKYKDQKKGQPTTKYLTKRGFYMDYQLKIAKSIPASTQYNMKDSFDQKINKKKATSIKIDDKLIKYTYIDRIEMEQKNRKKPAPGNYNLFKSHKQIDEQLKVLKTKKRSVGQKNYFYQDSQYLSSSIPGMGVYNPHLSVNHIRPDKKDHKFWIDKHKKLSQTFHKKRLSQPAPGSYSPCPLDITTFDRIKTADLINKRKNKTPKQTGFGTDAKFPYQRQNKKVIKEERPAPTLYNTMIQWKGKNADNKSRSWAKSVSTGFTKSIYNS